MVSLKLGRAAALCALVAACSMTVAQAAPAGQQSAQHAQVVDPTSAVAVILLKELAKGVGSEGLAQALTMMGVGGDAALAQQLAEISRQLARVNEQLTTLRNETADIAHQVNQSNFNNAASEAVPIVTSVDHAEFLMREAAKEKPGSIQQKHLAEEARAYIGTHLLDAVARLPQYVGGAGPAGASGIIATGWHVRIADHFVTHRDSVALRYLIDYYTGYEAAVVQLAVSYYTSDPLKRYSQSFVQTVIDRALSTVETQLRHRKDPVPPDTAVDVRSGLMWSTSSPPETPTVKAVFEPGVFGIPISIAPYLVKTLPAATGLKDWYMAARSQVLGLIQGWNERPDHWLAKNAGFPTPLEKGEGSQRNAEFWTSTLAKTQGTVNFYYVVDMSTGAEAARSYNGAYSLHGYLPVRMTQAGAYYP